MADNTTIAESGDHSDQTQKTFKNTIMHPNNHSSLLALSAELKLEVYRHVIGICLAKGHASDFAGLFLSCREIHTALETHFMERVRPLLLAKHKWQALGYKKVPLCLEIPHNIDTKKGKVWLSITLPTPRYKRLISNPGHGSGNNKYSTYEAAASVLAAVFKCPWPDITLRVAGHLRLSKVRHIYHVFFDNIPCEDEGGAFGVLRATDRIFLCYGNSDPAVNPLPDRRMFGELGFDYVDIVEGNSGLPDVERAHIAMVPDEEKGWQMVLDFKEGLDSVDGFKWGMKGSLETIGKMQKLFERFGGPFARYSDSGSGTDGEDVESVGMSGSQE